MLDMEQREVDLLEFEELRRSETTDKLPFLDRENTHTSHTHTHKRHSGQSKAQRQ